MKNAIKDVEDAMRYNISTNQEEIDKKNAIYEKARKENLDLNDFSPNKEDNNGFTKDMYDGGQIIMKEKKIVVTAPTPKEQDEIKAWMKGGKQAISLEDRINLIFEELQIVNSNIRDMIRKSLIGMPIKNNDSKLRELIKAFYNSIIDESDSA